MRKFPCLRIWFNLISIQFCQPTFKSVVLILGTRRSSFVSKFSTFSSLSSLLTFLPLLLLLDLIWPPPGSFRKMFFMLAPDLRKLFLQSKYFWGPQTFFRVMVKTERKRCYQMRIIKEAPSHHAMTRWFMLWNSFDNSKWNIFELRELWLENYLVITDLLLHHCITHLRKLASPAEELHLLLVEVRFSSCKPDSILMSLPLKRLQS